MALKVKSPRSKCWHGWFHSASSHLDLYIIFFLLCPHMVFPLCKHVHIEISFFSKKNKETNHIGVGFTLKNLIFNLITSLRTLSPNAVTFWGTGNQDLNIWIWVGVVGQFSHNIHIIYLCIIQNPQETEC